MQMPGSEGGVAPPAFQLICLVICLSHHPGHRSAQGMTSPQGPRAVEEPTSSSIELLKLSSWNCPLSDLGFTLILCQEDSGKIFWLDTRNLEFCF